MLSERRRGKRQIKPVKPYSDESLLNTSPRAAARQAKKKMQLNLSFEDGIDDEHEGTWPHAIKMRAIERVRNRGRSRRRRRRRGSGIDVNEKRRQKWHKRFNELKEFYGENGHAQLPRLQGTAHSGTNRPPSNPLYNWTYKLQENYVNGTLDVWQLYSVEELGLVDLFNLRQPSADTVLKMRLEREMAWKGRGIEAMAAIPAAETGSVGNSDIEYIPYDQNNPRNEKREAMLMLSLTSEVLDDIRAHRNAAEQKALKIVGGQPGGVGRTQKRAVNTKRDKRYTNTNGLIAERRARNQNDVSSLESSDDPSDISVHDDLSSTESDSESDSEVEDDMASDNSNDVDLQAEKNPFPTYTPPGNAATNTRHRAKGKYSFKDRGLNEKVERLLSEGMTKGKMFKWMKKYAQAKKFMDAYGHLQIPSARNHPAYRILDEDTPHVSKVAALGKVVMKGSQWVCPFCEVPFASKKAVAGHTKSCKERRRLMDEEQRELLLSEGQTPNKIDKNGKAVPLTHGLYAWMRYQKRQYKLGKLNHSMLEFLNELGALNRPAKRGRPPASVTKGYKLKSAKKKKWKGKYAAQSASGSLNHLQGQTNWSKKLEAAESSEGLSKKQISDNNLWNIQFQLLLEFRRSNGHFGVPSRRCRRKSLSSMSDSEIRAKRKTNKLYNWMRVQIKKCRNESLRPSRRSKLERIGFFKEHPPNGPSLTPSKMQKRASSGASVLAINDDDLTDREDSPERARKRRKMIESQAELKEPSTVVLHKLDLQQSAPAFAITYNEAIAQLANLAATSLQAQKDESKGPGFESKNAVKEQRDDKTQADLQRLLPRFLQPGGFYECPISRKFFRDSKHFLGHISSCNAFACQNKEQHQQIETLHVAFGGI